MTKETVNSFLSRHAIAFLAAAVSFGIGVGVMRSEIAAKADRSQVEAMATDIRTIKLILCDRAASDSYCKGRP